MTTTKAKKSSPNVLAYLAVVDQWKLKAPYGGDSDDSCRAPTENIQSLLTDAVTTKDAKFFASFVEQNNAAVAATTAGGAGHDHDTDGGDSTEDNATIDDSSSNSLLRPAQRQLLNTIAYESILLTELDNLYEEYSFATAKDASLTDDLRRTQKHQQQRHQEHPDQKQKLLHSEDSLVYGEVDLKGFCNLLQSLPASLLSNPRGRFYDIGSGSGRAVFAARFVGDFETCVGIELLENLHQMATSVQSLYKFVYSHKLRHKTVSFCHGDLLEQDDWWSDGTVVYAPSLLFDDEMMKEIGIRALKLQSGAYLISLKKLHYQDEEDISSNAVAIRDAFEMIQQSDVPMSWGNARVYVYRRR